MQKPSVPAFDPHEFLVRVGPGKTVTQIRKNQVLFSQGQAAGSLYYLQKGRIKLTVTSERGKEAVVGIIEPEQFFGEGCLAGQQLRRFMARAMESCEVTSIAKDAVMAALHHEPAFSELFIAHLLIRNSRIEENLIDQLFNSSEKRLARLLLLLANFGEDGSIQPIDVKFSQETLSEMIGTTRSRVSHFMNRFRKLGFISYNGTIKVHRSLINAVLHDKLRMNEADEPPPQTTTVMPRRPRFIDQAAAQVAAELPQLKSALPWAPAVSCVGRWLPTVEE